MKKIDEQAIANLRYLSATEISNAKSGHTGVSVGAGAIFYSLFKNGLKFSTETPDYFNRDRFTMCAGHASALLYATLHMFGYNYSMDDLKNYRRLGSITKGHPSVNPEYGVDATGGPLGQGIPMAVGMAIAEKKLASRFNKKDFNIIDHYTYCFAGDGSLMEGITNEASSLAGTLELNKLIVLYDSNKITIEGGTDIAFTEDVMMRYHSLGWNCLEVKNGNDADEIAKAISLAKTEKHRPTIIKINTTIGYKTCMAGSCKIHGTPLSPEQLLEFKHNLGINYGEFEVEESVKAYLNEIVKQKNEDIKNEQKKIEKYKKYYPSEYEELKKWLEDYYSKNIDWDKFVSTEDEATRVSSKKILHSLAERIPNLLSGSADLSSSIGTKIDGDNFSATNVDGRNLCFGVREHAMASICNGIALHGGFRVVCSTFMVFSDYMRHAIRMSALMNTNVIYLLSHDSIAVGEDGATHQPVEYNSMYRATPNINFVRPADFNETVGAYKIALQSTNPTIICLTRQKVKNLRGKTRTDISCGAYEIGRTIKPDCIIMATGSEVELAESAKESLKKCGINARVVSMPCFSLFDAQPEIMKQKLLPIEIRKRLFVEASSDDGVYKYVGLDGVALQIKSFGHTGGGEELMKEFGYTSENVENIIKNMLKK